MFLSPVTWEQDSRTLKLICSVWNSNSLTTWRGQPIIFQLRNMASDLEILTATPAALHPVAYSPNACWGSGTKETKRTTSPAKAVMQFWGSHNCHTPQPSCTSGSCLWISKVELESRGNLGRVQNPLKNWVKHENGHSLILVVKGLHGPWEASIPLTPTVYLTELWGDMVIGLCFPKSTKNM